MNYELFSYPILRTNNDKTEFVLMFPKNDGTALEYGHYPIDEKVFETMISESHEYLRVFLGSRDDFILLENHADIGKLYL